MADIVDRLRRAEGSAVLPKVMLAHKNAEQTCLDAAGEIERLRDRVDGLESDLESAVAVAWGHGAHDWVRLNYPSEAGVLANGRTRGG